MSNKTTSVMLVVGARNETSKALNSLGGSIERVKSEAGDLAGVVGESKEAFGDLFSSLGGETLSKYGDDVVLLRDKFKDLNRAQAAGVKGLTAMRLNILAIGGLVGFKIGKLIGDWIFDTKRWGDELEKGLSDAQRLGNVAATQVKSQIDRERERIQFLVSPGNQRNEWDQYRETAKNNLNGVRAQVEGLTEKIKEMKAVTFQSGNFKAEIASFEQDLANRKKILKIREEDFKKLNATESVQGRLVRQAKQRLERQKASLKIVKQLQQKRTLAAKSGEDRLRLELKLAGVRKEDLGKAVRLTLETEKIKQREQDRLQAAAEARQKQERIAADIESKRKKDAEERRKEIERVRDALKSNTQSLKEQLIAITQSKEATEAYRLSIKGVSAEDSKFLSAIKSRLEILKKAKDKSSIPTSSNDAVNDRLGRGTVAAKFQKTAAAIEAKTQTKIHRESQGLLKRLVEFESRKKTQPKINMIGS